MVCAGPSEWVDIVVNNLVKPIYTRHLGLRLPLNCTDSGQVLYIPKLI